MDTAGRTPRGTRSRHWLHSSGERPACFACAGVTTWAHRCPSSTNWRRGGTAALLRAVSDTGLTVLGLGDGRYELRALAIAHHPLTATFDFGPDTGAVATLRLERGAVSLCEDGIRARRLPWWRIW